MLGGATWRLTLEPVGTASDLPHGENPWWIQGEWAGAPFDLQVPANAARSWIRGRFPELDVGALAEPFVAAALEAAAAEILALLGSLQRGPARVEGIRHQPPQRSLPHVFGMILARDGDMATVQIGTSSLGLMLMAGLVARIPAVANTLAEESVPVLMRAELGVTWLSAAELRALRAGDAVLVEHPFIDQAGELWLGQDRWGLRVRSEGTGFIVTQTFAPSGSHSWPVAISLSRTNWILLSWWS
jgi:hypothetical protein